MTLDNQLAQLENSQLVRRLTDAELAYLFKHPLVQDTTYSSLLKQDRKRLHRVVAETLERAYPDHLDEFAALLAQHYAKAEEDAKALEYATRAGDVAARVYANAEALTYYAQALALAENLPGPGETVIQLVLKYGRVLEINGEQQRALDLYERAEDLGRARADRTLELAGLIQRAKLYVVHTPMHDSARGLALSQQALTLARDVGDPAAQTRILWNLSVASMWSGQPEQSIQYGEEAVRLAREHNLRELLAYALSDLAYAHTFMGNPQRGLESRRQADAIWRELDNQPMLADNLTGMGLIHIVRGEYARALKVSEEAFAVSEAIGNDWGESYAGGVSGLSAMELGQMDYALASLQNAHHKAEAGGAGGPLVASSAGLATLHGYLGAFDDALEYARLSLQVTDQFLAEWRAWPLALLVRFLLARGDVSTAQARASEGLFAPLEEHFRKLWLPGVAATVLTQSELLFIDGDYARVVKILDAVLEHMQRDKSLAYISDLLLVKSRALQHLGRADEAQGVCRDALAYAEKMNTPPSRWRVSAALAEFDAARGDTARAAELREKAREDIRFIAAHLSDAHLSQTFFAQPSVRAVVEEPSA